MSRYQKRPAGVRGQPSASPRIFLRSAEGEPLSGALGFLASVMGLNVYKTSLLGQRARSDLQAAALMLTVIFFFDFGAWTLLFNTLLHAKMLRIDGWSVLAVLAGLLFATAILLYERQFFTTDLYDGWRRLVVPMSVRLAIIIMAAAVTAQPVELLFFKEAIAQRAHEEGIRLEVVTRRKEGERIQKEREELLRKVDDIGETIKKEPEWGEHQTAQKKLTDLSAQEAMLRADVSRAEGSVSYWRGEATRRRRLVTKASTDEERRAREAAVQEAVAAQRGAQARLEDRRFALRQAQSQLPGAVAQEKSTGLSFKQRRTEIEQRLDGQVAAVKSREERIERWVRQLLQVKPGDPEPIVEDAASAPPDDRWRYQFPDYHFFRQLRVLKDLRVGNPPRWEGASADEVKLLAEQYGLKDTQPLRRRQETQLYFWSWLVVYAVSFVIPLLVIAMKFLMTPELKAYYSTRCQALAGSPDAVAFQHIAAEAALEELNTHVEKGISILQTTKAEI